MDMRSSGWGRARRRHVGAIPWRLPLRVLGPGSPRRIVVAGAAVAAVATLIVSIAWGIDLGYRRPVLHAGLETAESLVALLVGYLVVGRFQRTRSVADLLLASALGLLAIGNLCLGAIPALVSEGNPGTVSSWAAVAVRLLGALVYTVAAFAPMHPVAHARRVAAATAAASVGAIVATVAALDTRPELIGHPGGLTIQLIAMIAYGVATVGFLRRADRTSDDLPRWLALGAVFAAFAWLSYFLYPSSLYAQSVYAGDIFRFAFYVVLLIGGLREISSYWVRFAGLAVLEERRRLARDLHDGLAHELAFIVRRAQRLEAAGNTQLAHEISSAARRALDESRGAIAALTRPLDEPLDVVLEQALSGAGERYGTDVQLSLADDVRVSRDICDDLVRIAAEAVANAARHGGADVVRVELNKDDRIRLRVVDDGTGFDPNEVERTSENGFGLVSMRERARRHGAQLRIDSKPGHGTAIEVMLP
jgi:signal transduction histidine kinase